MRKIRIENPELKELIIELKKLSSQHDIPLWKRVAKDLEKPARNRRSVNISKINRYTKENDVVVVPGKVLGSGMLDHNVVITAPMFSKSAIEKINKKGKAVKLDDFIKKNPKPKGVRIIG